MMVRLRNSRLVRRAAQWPLCVLLCLFVLAKGAAAASVSPDTVVGTSPRAMSPRQTAQSYGAQAGETALGDYVADAIRAQCASEIAIVCGGQLENSLPGGALTAGDVTAVFGQGGQVCVVTLGEGQLFALLEHAVGTLQIDQGERLDPASGFAGFPQVSGFSFTWDVSQRAGRRIRSVTLDSGAALSAGGTGTFSAALPLAMLDGSLGFSMLEGLEYTFAGTQAQLMLRHLTAQPEVRIPETARMTMLGAAGETIYEALDAGRYLPYVLLLCLLIRLPARRRGARQMRPEES